MRTLSIFLAAILFHTQLVSAAGCDLPMFGGARLFGGVNNSTYLATADFNQDGFPDVVLGGPYTDATGKPANGISVLMSNGDGTFQPPVYYPFSPNGASDLVVADFNGDGKPDLAVAANSSIMVMLGNGDGTFQAALRTAVSANLMAVGDFNGDGKADLVLSESVSVLLGKGDGTFQAPIVPSGLSGPFGGVAVGDFNGDGKLDVVAPNVSGGVLLMLGDGTGKLGAPAKISTGASLPGTLAVSDLNGDHKLDIVSFLATSNTIAVLLGNGSGGFQAATSYTVSGALSIASSLLVADLNGDGSPDLAVSFLPSFTSGGDTIAVFPGNGDGTFGAAVQYTPVLQDIWAMAAGDFNGDGLIDVVFTSNSDVLPSQVGLIFGAANGTLQSPVSYAVGLAPGPPVLADLNGDGVLDLVETPSLGNSGNLSVLLGNGDGSFQSPVSYPAAAGATFAAVGDFNGDGKPDLAVSSLSLTTFAFNLLVFLGNGDGTFRAPTVTAVNNSAYVVVGDFNKDGKLDVAVGGQILLGNGDGTFRVTSASVTAFMLAADLDGDGNLDMIGTGTGGMVLVQLGNGDGTFRPVVRYPIGKTGLLAVGDLNGDGKPDVVAVSDVVAGTIAVLLNNGDGTFQPAVKYVVARGLYSVAMGDFNGDGSMDVVVTSGSGTSNPATGVTVLLGNGDGTFRNALTYGAPTGSLGVGDLNRDGKPDLAIAGANVQVLLNTYVPGNGASACALVPASAN